MIEVIGWLGTILFSICALPQATLSYRVKHAKGISSLFLLFWLGGEVLTTIYILHTSKDIILLTNYIFNMLCLFVILYYKLTGEK